MDIPAAIAAVGNALTEAFKFAQTPQGQALVERSLKDGAEFQRNVQSAGQWLARLFTGKL